MKRTVTALVLLVVASAAYAGPAPPGFPDPANSMVEPILVGGPAGFLFSSAIPGDAPGYQVVVRDIAFSPVSFAVVKIVFAGVPGVRVYNAQNAGTIQDCPSYTIAQTADVLGRVNIGGRTGGFAAPGLVRVTANGVLLNWVEVRSTDLDGAGGRCDAADASVFRTAFFSGIYRPEIDYDLNGTLGVGDLNLFRAELFAGTPVQPYCP